MLGVNNKRNNSAKSQIIDDEQNLIVDEDAWYKSQEVLKMGKNYHVVSIIGSQSTGKSSLLNTLYNTKFDVLNRSERVGQTTRGIWCQAVPSYHTLVFDVEGSDSTERGSDREKSQRKNSLFALAMSHTLFVNIWVQQVGLNQGSQKAILEIILMLNLRLFGAQHPKQIIYIVRDCSQGENHAILQQKLFKMIETCWKNMPKPEDKKDIKLQQVFSLKAFFLHSKLVDEEEYIEDTNKLRQYILNVELRKEIFQNNVDIGDFHKYMENIWKMIEKDKDINIPEEKILISNMRCHEIKAQAFAQYEDDFINQLQKSKRIINLNLVERLKQIIQQMLSYYQNKTQSYNREEMQKVKKQFYIYLDSKISIYYSYHYKLVKEQCLKVFQQTFNEYFLRNRNVENFKEIKPRYINKFKQLIVKVTYNPSWIQKSQQQFQRQLEQCMKQKKQIILVQSLKQYDVSIKKQVQNIVNNAFYDKKTFCKGFWQKINIQLKEIQHKAKNSITNLLDKLDFQQNDRDSRIKKQWQTLRHNAKQNAKSAIKNKVQDLKSYIKRHFTVDFNSNQNQIPRQWNKFTPQEIKTHYDQTKKKYLDLIEQFVSFQWTGQGMNRSQKLNNNRLSSVILSDHNQQQLIQSAALSNLIKAVEEMMKQEYDQAIKKNKDSITGRIPSWAFWIFLIVAFDDILSWVQSPYLLIPLVMVLLCVALLFALGGKTMGFTVLNTIKQTGKSIITSSGVIKLQ